MIEKTNRAIQYRLYPTADQIALFIKTFGCCRKVWNLMLADKIAHYKKAKTFGHQTPAVYKKQYPYLKAVDSLALANVQLHLQSAFKSCFDKKRKRRNGFPKFKSRKRTKCSYTTNNVNGNIVLLKNGIRIPKAGTVRAKIHRLPKEDWKLKSVTISQEKDGKFYASVLFEYERKVCILPKNDTLRTIGLDYKSDGLFADSCGHVASSPKYYRRYEKKLAKAQRILSRRIGSRKGEARSHNYDKQLKAINRIYAKIANCRKDHLHKLSTEITNQYNVVCVESLDMRAMANRGFGNGKATLDNGYGMFLNMLDYKLADKGGYLIKVDKWYPSSQICSHCGAQKSMPLENRIYKCPECGNTIDRDLNAAINIKNEGLRILLSA